MTGWVAALIVAPGLVIFVFPMASLIAGNDEYFRGAFGAGWVVDLAGFVTVGVGFGLWAVSGTRIGRVLFTGYALLTPAWLVYRMFGSSYRAIGAATVALLATGAAILLARRPRPRLPDQLGQFATVVVLITGVVTVLEVAQAGDSPSTDVGDRADEEQPDLPTIYHLVLDEYQTEMFEAVLDDEMRSALAGFTWYPDAQTTWGRTELSMASTLAGDEWAFDVTPQEYVDHALRGSTSSLRQLEALGYETAGSYNIPSLYGGDPSPFDHRYLASDAVPPGPSDEHQELATSLWIYAHTPGAVAERLLPERYFEQLEGDTLLPDDAAALSMHNFDAFLEREPELPTTGRYELVHLILPHFPYVLTEGCDDDERSETSPAEQTECTMRLVARLLDELHRLDRFDDATIVVQGDHGASLELSADGALTPVVADDFYSPEWSAARARPLLLMKPAGVGSDEPLATSDYPAQLSDVMPTVFDAIGADVPVADGRVSLLAADLPSRPERLYHFYDAGPDNLPDDEVQQYVIRDGEVIVGERLAVP
jgi:hypothetical protein